jgi:Uma2 family endonuclease
MKNGVKEYWIVSPESKEIHVYNFEGGELKTYPTKYRKDELLILSVFE